ncbi:MAG TPA: chromosomal replication initiator protein DnaA, partial [Gammaproteobacteria bacterium]|nr:chromosomal replication initiator protein DnaA [Gammaproteobacteria bacterium]
MSSALWEQCLSHLENNLTAQQLNTWLFPLQAIESADTLTLLAPNTYVKAWVSEQLEAEITTLITQLSHGNIARLKIDVGQQPAINPPQASEKTSEKTPT